jgi:hypothetical protein
MLFPYEPRRVNFELAKIFDQQQESAAPETALIKFKFKLGEILLWLTMNVHSLNSHPVTLFWMAEDVFDTPGQL